MKHRCICGYEAATRGQILEHVELLKPHVLHVSRLLPFVTNEKAIESENAYAQWKKEHGLIDKRD
jgi:hypothetical protein